jgi:dTDP-4-dehydrorhamnose reductase
MFSDVCRARGLACSLISSDGDADSTDLAGKLLGMRAWALVNLDADLMRLSSHNPACASGRSVARAKHLAHASARARIPLVHVSSHLVFDGKLGRPYTESDRVSPDGRASCELVVAERAFLGRCPECLIVRAGPLFGVHEEEEATASDGRGETEGLISPAYAPDLLNAILDLMIDGERGIWHLANRGQISSAEFSGLLHRKRPRADASCAAFAEAPLASLALTSTRGNILPTLHDALSRFLGPDHDSPSEEPIRVAAE